MITLFLLLIAKCLALLSLRGMPSSCDTPKRRNTDGAGET
jgi:hypothetical protein